ncbi:MAG: Tic20 family protein [Oscillatoria sp. PMC 1068.18]|nr:Tic20 family protein [Oscillatoria sp. PMC 1076.18]MEC4989295.1 Tic20 family protein [Oscillatoria sp. PMC 1068.18]
MTWRGSIDIKDKIFGALAYLLPLIVAFPFGVSLLAQFPVLSIIYLPLAPLLSLYYGFQFASLIIFFVLFLAVVRNERISHFIRFNTMQAILIDILLFLVALVLGVIGRGLQGSLLLETLNNVVFLGTLAACGYSIVQSLRGQYAEIPQLSEAVYSQVR